MNDALYRFDCRWKDLVRNNLVRLISERGLDSPPPRKTQFRVYMNNVHSSGDRLLQVLIIGS
jgi:hypothetical protein